MQDSDARMRKHPLILLCCAWMLCAAIQDATAQEWSGEPATISSDALPATPALQTKTKPKPVPRVQRAVAHARKRQPGALDDGILHMSTLSPREKRQLERLLTQEVQALVDRINAKNGIKKKTAVQIKIDGHRSKAIANLGRNFLPARMGAEWEETAHAIETEIDATLYGLFEYRGTEFQFSGIDILKYFPEERAMIPKSRSIRAESSATPVMVAPGHGVYRHYGFNDWRPQRDEHNGIVEDFITPLYAVELNSLLHQRGFTYTDAFVRSSSTELHPQSNWQRQDMAARYHLEEQIPNRPDIWDSLNSTDSLRDYDDDIRSRPLYANARNASTLIHIHTNASDDPSVRGARVYVYTGRSADTALATNVLCAMKQTIQALPEFAAFPVSSLPIEGNHGENRLAEMPSIIVEVAYHTNAQDAAALKNPAFRKAAMKGVERGYRAYRAGKTCAPFAITSIPQASGPQNISIPIQIHFAGQPQFPIAIHTTPVICAPGWTCWDYDQVALSTNATHVVLNVRCNTTGTVPSATFRVRTTLTDADGVSTSPVENEYTCTGP